MSVRSDLIKEASASAFYEVKERTGDIDLAREIRTAVAANLRSYWTHERIAALLRGISAAELMRAKTERATLIEELSLATGESPTRLSSLIGGDDGV